MAKVGCVDVGAIFNAVGVIKISWFSFKKAWLWYKGTWKKIHWKLRHHLVNVSTVVMSFKKVEAMSIIMSVTVYDLRIFLQWA